MLRLKYLSKGCHLKGTTSVDNFRFSLYSGAVITKALAVVVSLYYPLVSGSVE